MPLKPLQQFICDDCGQIIENPADGWLEWLEDDKRAWGFRIVHHSSASPKSTERGCYRHINHPNCCDMHLDSALSKCVPFFLHFLDLGEIVDPSGSYTPRIQDMREYAEIVRRLQIPYYEEARHYMQQANEDGLLDGANEFTPYDQSFLLRLIERYS